MKIKALLIAFLAMALMACNNTHSPKEDNDAPIVTEPALDDVIGTLITPDGLEHLELFEMIPDTIPGYDIVPVIVVYEEGIEGLELHVMKDGETLVVMHPEYDEDTDEPSDVLGGITVVSDKFATADGIHVGSSIQDVLKREGVTTLFDEQNFYVIDQGIDYVLNAEDYEGELPAVPFDIMAEVKDPTFKADAKIRKIQVYY